MTRFTAYNTDYQFNNSELAILNDNLDAILHLWAADPESDTYHDEVKRASELVLEAFPHAPEVL